MLGYPNNDNHSHFLLVVYAVRVFLVKLWYIILLLISPEYVASDVYDTEVTMACSLSYHMHRNK